MTIQQKAATVAGVLVALTFLASGLAYASNGSKPGDLLYGVDLASERVQSALTFNKVSKVQLENSLVNERVDELDQVKSKSSDGKEVADAAKELENEQERLDKSLNDLNDEKGIDQNKKDEVENEVENQQDDHVTGLDRALEVVKNQTARDAIEKAKERIQTRDNKGKQNDNSKKNEEETKTTPKPSSTPAPDEKEEGEGSSKPTVTPTKTEGDDNSGKDH